MVERPPGRGDSRPERTNPQEWWVVEYSQSQDAFHIQTLVKSLMNNQSRCLKKERNDWVLLFIGEEQVVRQALTLFRARQ